MRKSMIAIICIVIVGGVVLGFISRKSFPDLFLSRQADLIFSAKERGDKNVFEWISNPLVIKIQDSDKYTGEQIHTLSISDAQSFLKDGKSVFITLGSPDIPGIPATIIEIQPGKTLSLYQVLHPTKQRPTDIALENMSYLYSHTSNDEKGILTFLLQRPTLSGPKRHERIYIGILEKAQWNELVKLFEGNIPHSIIDDLDR